MAAATPLPSLSVQEADALFPHSRAQLLCLMGGLPRLSAVSSYHKMFAIFIAAVLCSVAVQTGVFLVLLIAPYCFWA